MVWLWAVSSEVTGVMLFFKELFVEILLFAAWLDSRRSAASYGAIEGTMKRRPNSQWT